LPAGGAALSAGGGPAGAAATGGDGAAGGGLLEQLGETNAAAMANPTTSLCMTYLMFDDET
jgi:hypothetical protein